VAKKSGNTRAETGRISHKKVIAYRETISAGEKMVSLFGAVSMA
jgi:hypothetical protein